MKIKVFFAVLLLAALSTPSAHAADTGWRYWGYFQAAPGATFGAFASGIASLLKVNAHPSTDPSSTLTVGPVIAAVHLVAPGAAWK